MITCSYFLSFGGGGLDHKFIICYCFNLNNLTKTSDQYIHSKEKKKKKKDGFFGYTSFGLSISLFTSVHISEAISATRKNNSNRSKERKNNHLSVVYS